VRRALLRHGVRPPAARFRSDVEHAVAAAHAAIAGKADD